MSEVNNDLEKKSSTRLDNFAVKDDEAKPEQETDNINDAQKRRVSIGTASRLRCAVLILSSTTIGLLTILGAATLAVSVVDHSASSFAFALTALLDCLSSGVVIWRYARPASLYSSEKERAACIAMGILFLISGICVIIRSALAIHTVDEPAKSDVIWYLAIVNCIACLSLGTMKMYTAYKLESISVASDGINSFIGFILALATLVGEIVYKEERSIWYIDPVLGICCSSFFFMYGIWLLVYEYRQSRNKKNRYESME